MKNGGERPLGAEQNVCYHWKDKHTEGVCVGGVNLIKTSSCQSQTYSWEVGGSWIMPFDWPCFIDSLCLYQSGVVLADNTATPSAAAPIISQSASSPAARPAAALRERERESCYTNTLQLKLQCTKLPHQHPPLLLLLPLHLSCNHQVKSLTQRLAN